LQNLAYQEFEKKKLTWMEGRWKKNTNQKSNPNIDNLLEKSEGKFIMIFEEEVKPLILIYDSDYVDEYFYQMDLEQGNFSNETM